MPRGDVNKKITNVDDPNINGKGGDKGKVRKVGSYGQYSNSRMIPVCLFQPNKEKGIRHYLKYFQRSLMIEKSSLQ